jgi:selenocysteine lyase/cysteine desulfurase
MVPWVTYGISDGCGRPDMAVRLDTANASRNCFKRLKALDFMQGLDWRAIQDHELRLTRRLLDGLAVIRGVRVLGPVDTHDRGGVVSFTVQGFAAEEICIHLDSHGVALRGGYHCAQPLFRALDVDGAARASVAPYTVDADVDALLTGLDDLIRYAESHSTGPQGSPPTAVVKRMPA